MEGPGAFVRGQDDAMEPSRRNAAEEYRQSFLPLVNATGYKSLVKMGSERLKKSRRMRWYAKSLHRPQIQMVKRRLNCIESAMNLAT
jgi:hypothetical protein